MGSTLVLTRLLAPDLFGLVTTAMIFVYALAMFTDIGLRNALIQDLRSEHASYRNSIWLLTFARNLAVVTVLSGVTALIAYSQDRQWLPPESVIADPRLLTVLPLLALAEALRLSESTEVVVAERKLAFGVLFRFQLGKQLVTTFATVAWAWCAPGPLALCAGPVIGAVYGVLASHFLHWPTRPMFRWNTSEFKAILSRARWVIASSALTFLVQTGDKIYLSLALDTHNMGLYAVSLTLGLLVSEFAARLTASLLYPCLSRDVRENSLHLQAEYYRVRRSLEGLCLAGGFVLLSFGPDLAMLLYDVRYAGVGLLLQWFGLTALLLVHTAIADAFHAWKTSYSVAVSGVRLAALVVSMSLWVPEHGATGAAMAWAASTACASLTALSISARLGLLCWRQEARYLGGLLCALAAGGVLNQIRGISLF
jgi:O-antigen/teichoic acid export membrane protein